MNEITVYGASDDLIEVEGLIDEEFTHHDEENGDLLAFSTGHLLRVRYTNDGVWRVEPLSGQVSIVHAVSADDDNYSDRATFSVGNTNGRVWVVHGSSVAFA